MNNTYFNHNRFDIVLLMGTAEISEGCKSIYVKKVLFLVDSPLTTK